MLINRDNDGKVIGWMETYFTENKTVMVTVSRKFTTIARHDRTNGKWTSRTYLGTPPLPGAFEPGKK